MLRRICMAFLWLGSFLLNAQEAQLEKDEFVLQTNVDYNSLYSGFKEVPLYARMRVFWIWNNGIATKESITKDLESMKANYIGGANICDNGQNTNLFGPTFLSDKWLDLFSHAIKEADRLGLEISANNQSGMGDPGNPNVQPENSFKKIVSSEIQFKGPKKVKVSLPLPENTLYYKDIVVQAVRSDCSKDVEDRIIKNWKGKSYNNLWGGIHDAKSLQDKLHCQNNELPTDLKIVEEVIDLTSNFKNGILNWNVPEGKWTVIRYGVTSTGKKNNYGTKGYAGGLCYDHLHPNGVKSQWNEVVFPLIRAAQSAGNSLKYIHTDSWEMGIANWTHGFEQEFERRRGYSMLPYLPVLTGRIVKSIELSERFLEDYRLTIGDLAIENNYRIQRNLAHSKGLRFHSESAGPHISPLDGMRSYNMNDIAMGEFWPKSTTHRVKEVDRFCVKMGASASHIYGKRFFAAEGPTIVGPVWERSPKEVKCSLDKAFRIGVNRLFWHTYSSSPDEYGLPGIEYFAGVHLNRNVTWWKQSKAMIAYINRCQFMMLQGLPVSDVLGHIGSGVPLYGFLDQDREDIPLGYSWDMCNNEAFLERASVKDGRIYMPDGTNYALFALSGQKDMPLSVLQKIEKLVFDGMILVGSAPDRVTGLQDYPASDEEFRRIVLKLWPTGKTRGVHLYGKGKVYSNYTVAETLEKEQLTPDFDWDNKNEISLDYAHRSCDDFDIYFVLNKWLWNDIRDLDYHYRPESPNEYIQTSCHFRVKGDRVIERWDPLTGTITPISVYEKTEDGYKLPVTLAPEGSSFYVFRKVDTAEKHLTSITRDGQLLAEGNTPLQIYSGTGIYVSDKNIEINRPGFYTLIYSDGKHQTINCKSLSPNKDISTDWDVRFTDPIDKKVEMEEFKSLTSWTENSKRNIRYFSGTASYYKTFKLSRKDLSNNKVYLDLGNVEDIAEVVVNGVTVQTLWTAPYRLDITPYVRIGENELQIDITNLWVNRLIGDYKLPQVERKTWTVLETDARVKKLQQADADKYLRKSGLLGPVQLNFTQIISLKNI